MFILGRLGFQAQLALKFKLETWTQVVTLGFSNRINAMRESDAGVALAPPAKISVFVAG